MDNIKKIKGESHIIYSFRYNYIKKNINEDKFLNLEKNSKILANIKFKKCRYESKIYNKLKHFL